MQAVSNITLYLCSKYCDKPCLIWNINIPKDGAVSDGRLYMPALNGCQRQYALLHSDHCEIQNIISSSNHPELNDRTTFLQLALEMISHVVNAMSYISSQSQHFITISNHFSYDPDWFLHNKHRLFLLVYCCWLKTINHCLDMSL